MLSVLYRVGCFLIQECSGLKDRIVLKNNLLTLFPEILSKSHNNQYFKKTVVHEANYLVTYCSERSISAFTQAHMDICYT